jgi:hypothetical protein
VKSRSRLSGTETDAINIKASDIAKARRACKTFRCVPYFAFVVDAGDIVRVYLLSADHLKTICRPSPGSSVAAWGMTPSDIEKYARDPSIRSFQMEVREGNWRPPGKGKTTGAT